MAERAIPHIAWEAFRPVVDFVDANIERRVRLEEKRGVTHETRAPVRDAMQNLPQS